MGREASRQKMPGNPGEMDLANPRSLVAGTQDRDEIGEMVRVLAPGEDFIPVKQELISRSINIGLSDAIWGF